MDLGINDRIAIVTGASRNIGRSIAKALAKEGARLILISRSVDNLEEVIKEIGGSPGKHCCVALDLQATDSVKILKERLPGDFAIPDIIVHNLGGSLGVTDAFVSAEVWAKVWRYNVGIAHDLNREFIPAMLAKQWGRVVHLSTLSTHTYDGYAPYVSAKCALDGYIKGMSRLFSRHNVIMNAIAPGLIDIEGRYFNRLRKENPGKLEQYFDNHSPIRRMGTTEEIAMVTTFLCSEHASFMPGSIVRADGGGH